jgi:hypothetical protein
LVFSREISQLFGGGIVEVVVLAIQSQSVNDKGPEDSIACRLTAI